ncbi:c6 zinc finger domain containing protein [Diplodia corticola]|uniref:C6 zinc finger domain containing protein n=1 Tax=Diplodia corticola TaxID=236234 RepID=A0A1J9S176_9PEZI|nr:c6 zinc finger domain containing protein [Diplodia corticola]OJD38699.1 c6 zinc finger domain containing protein [Diplodia corticola]
MSDRPSPPLRARTHSPQQKEKYSPPQDQHDRRQLHSAEHEGPGGRSTDRLGAVPPRRMVYEGGERQQPPPSSSALRPTDQRPELRPSSSSAETDTAQQPSSQMGPFGYSAFGASGSFAPGYGGPTVALQPPAPLASQMPSLRNTKTARRNKAHVASACVNCKKAHLSCDVQRPCTRCVTSGKETSCYDVQHKKRGRPRLRDVQESRPPPGHELAEHSTSASESPVPGLAPHVGVRPDSSRPLRATRRSFGVPPATFRHPTSTVQSLSPSPYPQEGAVQYPTLEYARSAPSYVTPMALLNLDLHIIKTNQAFNLLFNRSDFYGRDLSELVESHHAETVYRLRSELREERDQREPSYMPPIFGPREQEAVQNVEEEDLERISLGYTDRRFTWRFSSIFGQPQEVRVRVRLAKTSIFFVSLTLPSFDRAQFSQPTSEQQQPQRYPHVFATPVPPHRSSRPSSRAAPTEYPYSPFGHNSPLPVAAEPQSPYSYFSLQNLTSSLPPAAAPTPTAQTYYGQAPPSGYGYSRGSWSSTGSAELHVPSYEVTPRRPSGQVLAAEGPWHNDPRTAWQQQQQHHPYPAYQRRPVSRGEQQPVWDPAQPPEGLAPASVRRVSLDERRSQGTSEGTQEEEPSKRRRLNIRDII